MSPQRRDEAILGTPIPDRGRNTSGDVSRASSHVPTDRDIRNPLHEPRNVFQYDQASRQQFIGESTCSLFGDRLLQCLNPQATVMASEYRYTQGDAFARQTGEMPSVKLPERIRANLLVRVAIRFIGQDYHFFLKEDFLQQLDRAYITGEYDAVWACKFFATLALGELYSTAAPSDGIVPGTEYFLTALELLQDLYEEPTTSQVETMLLFCFYSNALGRVKSAHVHAGIALRLSTCLGLHRSMPAGLTPVEQEHRIRLWWTVYIFDRSTSTRLGQPLSIQDADIEVGMPSEKLPPEAQDKFDSPAHLIINIKLSRIVGCILRDIYGVSSRSSNSFVSNVRNILKQLKELDANMPDSLRLKHSTSHRHVASLHLHFNQCIILTTRPILLHVLKAKNPFGANKAVTPPISDTAKMLAESCISAARTSNSLLSQLFVENALATYGYFDAHHLFSSTLVLIISAIISPNSSDSDAVQTAFHLLKTMRDNGNMAAYQYYARLAHIQWSVGRFRARSTNKDTALEPLPVTDTPVSLPEEAAESLDVNNYDWNTFLAPSDPLANYDWSGTGPAVDPLDNPLLQTFLDHTDASWDESLGLTNEDMDLLL
ncbi:uncharacterized protein HMPREF1541_09673 [Cyphellophora europaea CBS 101466]|uniref:Xylanolytic transcriptional activator regulatory domain-containing protein n=1 Tax=Cyphellophora europaea (strain CBS 101466) TaxID=1220924 RepID=W2S9T8_CYPE1|nr:uncharacterized protein HMPREF1541_09673 [Cyphellophora europaea CBS 101466]ETN44798.1 hypothetical protein HMPREF1541_09673 [Cyphellophora europaea CBS 101466]